MAAVERLVTVVDVADEVADDRHVSVDARHEAVLTDGRRLLLLDDRGWGETRSWATVSAQEVEETTRVVVGPDEPPEGRTREEMEADHWNYLARILRGYGVTVDAQELRQLRHDVVFSERLLTRIGQDPGAAAR
ncbi:MAG: hypothetical protein GEV03_20110 [Streptosporangiales bacterium]|nr:hypothetical protein [Streptosporangiales bacterium]